MRILFAKHVTLYNLCVYGVAIGFSSVVDQLRVVTNSYLSCRNNINFSRIFFREAYQLQVLDNIV